MALIIVFLLIMLVMLWFSVAFAKEKEAPTHTEAQQKQAFKKLSAIQHIGHSKHAEIDEDDTGQIIEYAIVGESNYQNELMEICGGDLKSKERKIVEAIIFPEPENPYDNNAVAIKISGKIVGHIPKEDARWFHELLKDASDRELSCPAEIRGGRTKRNGVRLQYGVFLKISLGAQNVI